MRVACHPTERLGAGCELPGDQDAAAEALGRVGGSLRGVDPEHYATGPALVRWPVELDDDRRPQLTRPRVNLLDVIDRKVDVVGIGFRLLATALRIHEREDDRAAVEVVAGSVDPPSFRVQQLRVEVGRLVQIGHLQGHTEQLRNLCHLSSLLRIGGYPHGLGF